MLQIGSRTKIRIRQLILIVLSSTNLNKVMFCSWRGDACQSGSTIWRRIGLILSLGRSFLFIEPSSKLLPTSKDLHRDYLIGIDLDRLFRNIQIKIEIIFSLGKIENTKVLLSFSLVVPFQREKKFLPSLFFFFCLYLYQWHIILRRSPCVWIEGK